MQCHSSSSPVGTDALVCPPLIIHSFVLPTLTHSFSSFYPTSFEIEGTPSSIPRNTLFTLKICLLCYHETPSLPSRYAFFVITKRPFCSQDVPSLLSRNALFTLKMCPLYYHETSFLHWFSSFFSSSFPPPPCYLVPPNGDRRSWMETSPSLPQGKEYLTVTCLNVSFYPKVCHKVRTDALVCPPFKPVVTPR